MLEPRIVEKEEMKIVGCVSYGGDIGELWHVFMTNEKAIQHAIPGVGYELHVFPEGAAKYHIMVGVEVDSFNDQPLETFAKTIPGGLYAVFLYKGATKDARATFQYIFGTWLPNSEYSLDNRPHFEVLGEKYKNDDPASEEDIWIPIRFRVF